MATAPRPGVGRRAEAEKLAITVKVDGEPFTVRPSEVSAKLVGQLRRVTGFSLQGLMSTAGEDPDLDVIAALVWLARRQSGENVSYDTVAGSLTYDSEIEPGAEPAPEDPNSPEA